MLETYPDKSCYALVDFWSGVPESHERYTNLSKDTDILGSQWKSLTTMGIELPEESFELNPANCDVIMPKQDWMLEHLSGFLVPHINIKITQILEWYGGQLGVHRAGGTWVLAGTVTDQGAGRYRIQNGSIRQDGILETGFRFRITYTIVSATNFVVVENGASFIPLVNTPGSHTLDFIAEQDDLVIKTTIASDVIIEAITLQQKFYDSQRETLVLFLGTVAKFISNFHGESGIVKVICAHIKDEFDIPLGIVGMDSCPWQFGSSPCKKDLVPLRENATITAIDGLTVTLSGLVTTGAGYWEQGYIEKSGIRARIRDYGGGTTMETERVLPPSWVGANVVLTPGCDKSPGVCDNRWNNIANFGGFAIQSPGYDPRQEVA